MNPDTILRKGYVFPLTKDRRFIKGLEWGTEAKQTTDAWDDDPRVSGEWGVATGKSGLLVLDVDVKNGKDGVASLANFPPLPKTYTVKTPSGGLHYFFKGAGPTTASQIAEGLDTRGVGGMVKHYDTVLDDSPIAPMPEWLKTWAADHAARSTERSGVDYCVDPDQKENVEIASQWLERAKPAIEGEGGDSRTVAVAAMLHDFGVSEDQALELMLIDWNERCDPPWDSTDLWAKIVSGFKYAKNDFGCRTEEYLCEAKWLEYEAELFADVEIREEPVGGAGSAPEGESEALTESGELWEPPSEEADDEEPPVRLSTLRPKTAPPQKWLIKDWIPCGSVTSFYGPPGAGKSLVCVEGAMCIASGKPWYGQRVDRPCPVLYVSCEDDTDELHRRADGIRLKDLHAALAGSEEDVHLWDRVGKDSMMAVMTDAGVRRQKFLANVEAELAKIAPEGEERALFIDTMIDVADLNENNRVHVNYFIKFILGGLAIRHNATVIFLAHPSKSSDVSGSTAFRGSVRAQLFLSRVEEDRDMRRLTRGKTNRSAEDDPEKGGILVRWKAGAFHHEDAAEFEKELKSAQKKAVFTTLEAATLAENPLQLSGHTNPLKDRTIADENGCELAWEIVRKVVNELISDGLVESEAGSFLKTVDCN